MAGDVDAEFNTWFNQHQPIRKILDVAHEQSFSGTLKAVQNELKQAFTHGFARGVASEVARFPPTDPELGDVR